MEKMEQSKKFIEEVEQLNSSYIWLYGAMDDVYVNPSRKFPALKDFLFGDTGSSRIHAENQLTFAKIWAGEIELVEKKPKYVIYQVDNDGVCIPYKLPKDFVFTTSAYRFSHKDIMMESLSVYYDQHFLFDQDFAFAMRDTGKFKIEKVVE